MPADKPVHWRNVVARANPEYLYAEDVGPSGSHVDVEVIGSGEGTVNNPDGGSKRLVWLAFRGAKKKLGCGATLCKTMTAICGTPDYREWRGWIRLAVITGKFRDPSTGESGPMDVIRIASQRPAAREKLRERREQRGEATNPQPGTAAIDAGISAEEQAEIGRIEREEQG